MSRFRLEFLRVNGSRRHLADEGINQKANADKNERNTQNLSHVQSHRLLKSHLWFLDEFYQEAHAEKHDEEDADECAPINLVQFEPVHPEEDETENQIAECLIQLRRVFRLGLSAKLEDKAPRKIGNITINL